MSVKIRCRRWWSSRWGAAVVVILAALILPGPVTADVEEIATVTASGSSLVVKDDVPDARKGAVLDAKRNAVDQVGSQVIAKTVVENFELVKDLIITKADGYIHRYNILEEGRKGQDYSVRISADVSSSALIDDATLIYNEMDKPRLMVVIPEVRGDEIIPTSQAETRVIQFFLEKGFSLVDQSMALQNIRKDELRKIAEGDSQAAAKVGLRAGAEAVVIGSASLGGAESVRGVLYASRSTVSLKAIRTDNAMIYAVSNQSGTEADATEESAQRKALDTASTQAARDVFWKLVKKWNEETISGTEIEMVLSGVTFSSLKSFAAGVRDMKGVSEVIQRSFDVPTAILTVKYQGDAMRLADQLDSGDLEDFDLEVTSVTKGKVTLNIR
jgi:hypothetical protein